jgi:multiple sugar transport system permease protein
MASDAMNTGILTNSDMKKKRYKVLYGVMFVFMVIYAMTAFLPVVWMMLSGFKSVDELYQIPASFLPKEIHLSKLAKVWNEMKFYKYYLSTFIMAGGAAAFDIVVSGLAGYVISRLKPVGTKLIFAVVFAVMLLPGTMRIVPLYMTFKSFPYLNFSMLDTYWPMWLMAAANAFDIILFKNFFDGISNSLVESAKIDGASNLRVFFSIMLPLSLPIFIVVAVFAFNGQMGQFLWPYLILSSKSKTVLGVVIYKMKTSNYTMDYQMLVLLFSIIPQLIIYAVFQKKIIGGINVGGVKG